MTERYDRLLGALREVALVNSVFFVVEWDEQVMMPPGGAAHRDVGDDERRSRRGMLIENLDHLAIFSSRTNMLPQALSINSGVI